MPDSIAISLILLLFLTTSLLSALATTECPADVSYPITVTLDKGKLFSECAQSSASVRVDVRSLFDVLSFSERDFLIFCRSSDCIKPVKALLQVTPTSCLITYQGAARNLSAEISTLYHKCAKTVSVADQTDEDYVYRYFLD